MGRWAVRLTVRCEREQISVDALNLPERWPARRERDGANARRAWSST